MCGPAIQYIKNVTASAAFLNDPGTFTHTPNGMPDYTPSEVIVNAINFNADPGVDYTYLLWSNITNDFIASFNGANNSINTPHTRIWLNAPLPNVLEFKLYTPTYGGKQPGFVKDITGDLVVHLDIIKYKS